MKSLFEWFDRSLFVRMLMVVLVVFMLSACTVAPAEGTDPGSLNEGQFYLVGLVTTVIVYAINVFAKRFPEKQIPRWALSLLVYVVALGLAIWWAGFSIPAFPAFVDAPTFVTALFAFITALLIALGPTVSFATLIYNTIGQKVLNYGAEKIGLGAQAGTKSLSPGRK